MVQRWGETWSADHPHPERTGAIIAAAIRVQKALGPGVLEDATKACLAQVLSLNGYRALREVRLGTGTAPEILGIPFGDTRDTQTDPDLAAQGWRGPEGDQVEYLMPL